ncbi:hypothetical protein C8R43DRAFT_479776 [Mycena crocata]|nr:hypothetical protein C8R43DRAFT_479776 [Mycena crocata]
MGPACRQVYLLTSCSVVWKRAVCSWWLGTFHVSFRRLGSHIAMDKMQMTLICYADRTVLLSVKQKGNKATYQQTVAVADATPGCSVQKPFCHKFLVARNYPQGGRCM